MLFNRFIASLVLAGSALGAPVKDLETRQSCSTIQVVHLAGTGEMGLGLVGSPLSAAIATAVPGTTIYSVPYDTSVEYIVTVAAGADMTASYLATQVSKCPNQRFVLSGYSKGALVVHSTSLTSAVKSKVLAILVFGDPARNINSPWPINSPSVDLTPRDGTSFCNNGDLFCYIGGTSVDAHLAYGTDNSTTVAASFVKAKV